MHFSNPPHPGLPHSSTHLPHARGPPSTEQYRGDSPRQLPYSLPPPTSHFFAPSLQASSGVSANPSGSYQERDAGHNHHEQQTYYPVHPGPYPSPHSVAGSVVSDHRDQMAVHAAVNRAMYPPMGTYQTPQSSSPASAQSPHHDGHNRGLYNQGFAFPQQLFYSQYSLPPQHHFGSHQQQQQQQQHSYPTVSSAHSNVLLSHPHTASVMQQNPASRGLPSSPGMKLEQGTLQPSSGNGSTPQNVQGIHGSGPNTMPTSSGGPNPNAAPGPIPATTPLVVRQDQNGVQWIAFEYSRDRVKMEYTIRCDVESVNIEELSPEFKSANCVYPRACTNKETYKGNRLHYESECNAVGWALAELNPVLREKRGLIQRAVDSWRNSNQDPRLRSRRVRRQAKINTRKAQNGATTPQPASAFEAASVAIANAMSTGRVRTVNLGADQLQHHHHSHSEHNSTSAGSPDVSASNEHMAVVPNHYTSAANGQSFSSPTQARHILNHYPTYPYQAGSGHASVPHLRDGMDDSLPQSHGVGPPSSWIKEEDEDKRLALFGDLPQGKKRKFILVDDPARGARVRVRVCLEGVKMEEMPDSHLRTNSVFPRSFYPRQMQSPPDSPGKSGRWDDDEFSDGELTTAKTLPGRGKTFVPVPLLDGSQTELPIPRMSRTRRAKECALNELGYRMSWSQAKTFNERTVFIQKSLDAYRDKLRSTMLASGQDEASIAPHFETRPGKRKWLDALGRRKRMRRGTSS